MKSRGHVQLLLLLLQVSSLLCNSNFDKETERENHLSKIEQVKLTIANTLETKLLELKESLPTVTLSEKVLPFDFAPDTPSLSKFHAFKTVQWNMETLLIAVSDNETFIFSLVFSGQEVFLDEMIRINHINIVDNITFLKVLLYEDYLWIYMAASDSKVLSAMKVDLNEHKGIPFHQIIPIRGFICGVSPFITNGEINVVVASNNEFDVDGNKIYIEIFASKYELLKKTYEESLMCDPEVDLSSFLFKEKSYVTFKCKKAIKIWQYDPIHLRMKEIQKLPMEVQKMIPFRDEFTDKQFFILIRNSSVEITWFRAESLFIWKEIELINPQSGSTYNFHWRNFLLFTNKENFSIYDQSKDGNFHLKWNHSTTCDSIKEIDVLTKDEEIIFAIYCNTTTGRTIQFANLISNDYLTSEIQMDTPSEDSRLEKCLDELETTMKRHQPDIRNFHQIINNGYILSSKEDQVLSQPVSFKSLEVKGKIEGKNVAFNLADEFSSLNSRLKKISSGLNFLSRKKKIIEAQQSNLLTFNTTQHITASIKVPKMISNHSIILSMKLEKLNGVPYNDYKSNFLLLNKDQIVKTNLYLDKMITKNIDTKILTDNTTFIDVKDFLNSRKANQLVTGHHLFSSIKVLHDIEGTDNFIPMEINNIKTSDIIKTYSNVEFEDTQTFSRRIKVKNNVNIGNLNGVDYDLWRESLIRIKNDSLMTFGGSIIVHGNVKVEGNVKVVAVNGLDIQKLYKESAKRSNYFQTIKGPLKFTDLQVENIEVQRVNDVDWKHYLRLRDKDIVSHFNFDEGVVLGDLNSDSINGLNLDEEVLLSGSDQNVLGRLTFVTDVDVSGKRGVTMAMGATINGVDPSFHSSFGPAFNQEFINKKINLTEVLKINGDIKITKINNVKFPDFENDYWTKSTPQRFSVDVAIESGNFEKSLHASSFNGFELDNYLVTDVEQTLTGENFCMCDVYVNGNAEIEDGKTLNGVELSVLRDSAISLTGAQSIQGHNEFLIHVRTQDIKIKDGILKGINVEELFDSTLYPGHITFRDSVYANDVSLNGNLNVETINGRNSSEVLYDRSIPISKIKGNVYMQDLAVQKFYVTNHLNGKNFSQWFEKTVSKRNSASIPVLSVKGDLSFSGSLNVQKMNSKPFETYLNEIVQNRNGSKISGKKSFLKPVEVLGELTADYINGINLNELQRRLLSRSKPQTVKGKYKFNSGLTATTVDVPVISGFPVDEIVLTNSLPKFEGSTQFLSDVRFNRIESDEGLIDGCNVENALNPPQVNIRDLFTSNVTFGSLKIDGKVTIGGKLYSGPNKINAIKFLESVVRKSENQDIYGPTRFTEPVVIDRLYTKFINDYSAEKFIEKLSTPEIDVQTNCNLKFEKLLVDELIIGNSSSPDVIVNGKSLELISEKGIRKQHEGLITGRKTFLSNAFVKGKLKVPKIGKYLFETLIVLQDDLNLHQEIIFNEPIVFMKNLQVNGLISLTEPGVIFKPFINTKEYSSLLPPEYNRLIIEGSLMVESINDLRLDDVVVTSSKSPQVIDGRKLILGGIFVEGKSHIDIANGIYLDHLLKGWKVDKIGKTDRYVRNLYGKESVVDKKAALEEILLNIGRLNDLNYIHVKGLHEKLLYVTQEDKLLLPGVSTLHPFKAANVQKMYALVHCVSLNSCPCLESYTMKISDNSSKLDLEFYFNGKNIPVTFANLENRVYNFYIRCRENEFRTLIGLFQHYKGTEYLVTMQNKTYGDIINLFEFHVNEKAYFVLLSQSTYNNEYYLKVLKPDFDVFWEKKLYIQAVGLHITEIRGVWHLLVVGESVKDSFTTYRDESQLFIWDIQRKQFVLYQVFPSAPLGEIISFADETYLVLAKSNYPYEECSNYYLGGNLEIYRFTNSLNFYPFSSLPAYGVSSMTSFAVGDDLYLVTASKTEHSISIYRLVKEEIFETIQSISIGSPSSVKYQKKNGNHYLIVASRSKFVTLFKLHFRGIYVSDPKGYQEF